MNKIQYVGYSLLFIILLHVPSVFAQTANRALRSANLMNQMAVSRLGVGSSSILTMPSTDKSEVEGNTYWDEHWAKSSILLKKDEQLYEGHLIRYDIKADEFEFRTPSGVKVLRGDLVKNAVWIDSLTQVSRYMVNAKGLQEDGVPLVGFLELLAEGKNNLYKKVYLEILKPDFNPALNVGSKNTRILKKESYYYSVGDNIYKIKNRKSLDALGKETATLADEIIKKEKLKLSKENELVKLFLALNGPQP